MFDVGSWDIRNVFQGHSMALLLLYAAVLLAVGAMHIMFKGAVVV